MQAREFPLGDDHMRVVLREAIVEVQVGLHPWERHPERPSRLAISVDLFVSLKKGAVEPQHRIVDYDHVRAFILSLRARPHIDLLETIVDDISEVCFRDERVAACRVSVLKPDIFNEASAAGIEVFRTRAGWDRSES